LPLSSSNNNYSLNGLTVSSYNSIEFEYDDPEIFDVYATPTSDIVLLRVTISGKNFCASEQCCQTLIDDGLVGVLFFLCIFLIGNKSESSTRSAGNTNHRGWFDRLWYSVSLS
jgi:hypothetical protein